MLQRAARGHQPVVLAPPEASLAGAAGMAGTARHREGLPEGGRPLATRAARRATICEMF